VPIAGLLLAGAGAAQAPAGAPAAAAERARDAAALRRDMALLRAQLEALEARLATLEMQAGVGGSQAPEVAAPPAAAGEETRAVASAIYTGTVHSLTRRILTLRDARGELFSVPLGERAQASRDGKPLALEDIPRGAHVRATVSLLPDVPEASEIQVLALPTQR
jgi:hypothetical protein